MSVYPWNGRKRHRGDTVDETAADNESPEAKQKEPEDPEVLGQGRRGRKSDQVKRFECTYEGCGKYYSRAEHLSRHQLNRESTAALLRNS